MENKSSSCLNETEIPNTQTVGHCGKQRPEMLTMWLTCTMCTITDKSMKWVTAHYVQHAASLWHSKTNEIISQEQKAEWL